MLTAFDHHTPITPAVVVVVIVHYTVDKTGASKRALGRTDKQIRKKIFGFKNLRLNYTTQHYAG